MVKKGFCYLVVASLLSLPGCWHKKKKTTMKKHDKMVATHVDIPFAQDETQDPQDENIRSFFDQDVDEFVPIAQDENMLNLDEQGQSEDQLSWEESEEQREVAQAIYFDFDKYEMRQDQQMALNEDVALVKHVLENSDSGEPTIVVEGHACHSAGTAAYNTALSEKRAKKVADRLIAEGISADSIKVVGRGQEIPAIVDGKKVTGSRQEQWPNRRVEVHIVYS